MSLSRRQFVSGVGASLSYIICTPYSISEANSKLQTPAEKAEKINQMYPGVRHRDWIKISADGQVSVFTARNEIGQGVQTVIVNVLSQGLDLAPERIRVVMGDTLLCPNDGSTTGSNATQRIVWSFWMACFEIRKDLILLASRHLGLPAADLTYSNGEIYPINNAGERVTIQALANDQERTITVTDESELPVEVPPYRDPGTVNVNAEAIVTGQRTYTSDHQHEKCLYGGFVLPPFHSSLTRPDKVDFSAALAVAGVIKAEKLGNRIAVLADSYVAVQKGLAAVEIKWQEPDTPPELEIESLIREGRKLVKVVEQKGNPDEGFDADHTVVSESYISQYGTQVPIETDTALAEKSGESFVIRIGTQNPFLVRRNIAEYFGMPDDAVRVISMPTGGGFGAKTGHAAGLEAAILAQWAGQAVKLVHSRKYNIQSRNKYKAAVVFDVSTAVDSNGRLVSRKIDIHQDVGKGTDKVYRVPNVLTSLYKTEFPYTRAIMRGTSYTQNIWALESHIDMLAAAADLDPLEFRRRNVGSKRYFLPLIDSCADMINYTVPNPEKGKGVGFGMIYHGGRQLGVVGARVEVNATTGKVQVLKLVGSFDIGKVVNRTLARTGVESAMLWGLSWALLEEVKLDRHRCHTTGFTNYNIARFTDTPEMDVSFLGENRSGPRGCGEMPLPAAIAAISNAVFHATGVRFYELPMTAKKVKAALA